MQDVRKVAVASGFVSNQLLLFVILGFESLCYFGDELSFAVELALTQKLEIKQ